MYLLCAGAYVARDYLRTLNFRGHTYKWGYFPETKYYDIDELISKKEPASILWAGRLIKWKHPEASIYVAEQLKKDGYNFTLNIVGDGELFKHLEDAIIEKGLNKNVNLLGAMRPDQVREQMEKAQIFLFTSDSNEGWGAVLNESMNSGCAVVAAACIGSVPFLINESINGLTYTKDHDLYIKTKFLLDNPEARRRIGEAAYKTISEEWNAFTATERLLELSRKLKKRESTPYVDGPCSLT